MFTCKTCERIVVQLGVLILWFVDQNTVCVVHLADIKFGDLEANTIWLTFSLANQLSS